MNPDLDSVNNDSKNSAYLMSSYVRRHRPRCTQYSKRYGLNVRCCDFLYVFIFFVTLPICCTLAEMCVVKTIKIKQNKAGSDTRPEILCSISVDLLVR